MLTARFLYCLLLVIALSRAILIKEEKEQKQTRISRDSADKESIKYFRAKYETGPESFRKPPSDEISKDPSIFVSSGGTFAPKSKEIVTDLDLNFSKIMDGRPHILNQSFHSLRSENLSDAVLKENSAFEKPHLGRNPIIKSREEDISTAVEGTLGNSYNEKKLINEKELTFQSNSKKDINNERTNVKNPGYSESTAALNRPENFNTRSDNDKPQESYFNIFSYSNGTTISKSKPNEFELNIYKDRKHPEIRSEILGDSKVSINRNLLSNITETEKVQSNPKVSSSHIPGNMKSLSLKEFTSSSPERFNVGSSKDSNRSIGASPIGLQSHSVHFPENVRINIRKEASSKIPGRLNTDIPRIFKNTPNTYKEFSSSSPERFNVDGHLNIKINIPKMFNTQDSKEISLKASDRENPVKVKIPITHQGFEREFSRLPDDSLQRGNYTQNFGVPNNVKAKVQGTLLVPENKRNYDRNSQPHTYPNAFPHRGEKPSHHAPDIIGSLKYVFSDPHHVFNIIKNNEKLKDKFDFSDLGHKKKGNEEFLEIFSGPDDDVDSYTNMWLIILKDVYKMVKKKSNREGSEATEQILDNLLDFLEEIEILSDEVTSKIECPKFYYKVGELCLALDFLDSHLDYHEARLYCQIVKGGDLVMFRNANEFANIQYFIRKIDPEREFSYWVGLSDEDREGDWRFIDGRICRFGAPFWGVRAINCAGCQKKDLPLQKQKNYNSDEETYVYETALQPEILDRLQNYAILMKDDYHYLHDVSPKQAEKLNTIPLCQYIPERDDPEFGLNNIRDPWINMLDKIRD